MGRKNKIFFLIALVLTVVSCGRGSYERQLVEIDSLTLSEPAKAVGLLDSLDKEAFSTADRMYLELLKIKARDKAYVEHRSDSTVSGIVEYFESHDRRKLAEAYYYAGSVYRDMHDAPQAVAYFQKCIDALPDDSDLKMKSNACYQCGTLFRNQNLQEQAVEMLQRSYRCDSLAGDTIRMLESLMATAMAKNIKIKRTEQQKEVIEPMMEALRIARELNNDRQIATMMAKIVFVYSYTNEPDKMTEYLPWLEEYLKTHDDKIVKANYSISAARRLITQKQYDAALPYCEYLIKFNFADYRRYAAQYLYKIYASKNDFAKADPYLDCYEFLTDSIMVSSAQDATAQANALYNYQLRERDNLKLKAESQARLYTIFIFCAGLIVSMLVFWLYRLRQKQKLQTLNQQIARLHQLEKMQKEQNEQTATQQDHVRQRLFDSEAYAILKQRLAKNKPLKRSDLATIDETINKICDGFKSTLYSAYNLSEQEYAVCLLLKFELSTTEIGNLLSRTKSAITMSRKRLFMKLFGRGGDANELDIYIRSL